MTTPNVIDDGTLDAVLSCNDCGEEARYNWEDEGDDPDCEAEKPGDVCNCWNRFVIWTKHQFEEMHECSEEGEP